MLVFPLAAPRHISAAFQERFSALLHGEYAQSRFWKYFTFWDCFLLDDDLPSKRTRDNTFLPLAPSPLSMHCAMLSLLAESLTNNVSAHVCHLKSIIIQTQLIFPPQTYLMCNLWQCPLQPCLFVCVQAHLYSICVRVIDRWWRISWRRLGYVSRFLHCNDIPPCVCFPPVSYSSVQSGSARLLLCRLQLFPLPFLSN